MHCNRIRLQRVAAETITVRTIITGRQPRKRWIAGVLFREKEKSFVAVDDLITGHGVTATVRRNDAVIPHIDDGVPANFGVVRVTKPDAVQSFAHVVVVHPIAGTESQLDRVIVHAGNRVTDNRIIRAAGQRVCLDKNSIPIAPSHLIIRNRVAVRAILHHNAAGVATPTNRAGTPRALAHIIDRRIVRDVTILRAQHVDTPRRIFGCGVALHTNSV